MSIPTSRPVRRFSAALGFLALAAVPALAQNDEAVPKTFSESTTVLVVEVPVTVHKDRLPVRGLTAENFEIREKGEHRELVGFEVIAKVPPLLHTPLMSGSNAISGITIVGAILAAGHEDRTISTLLGFVAIVFATINVVGGFLVTNRMLAMFRTKKRT